MQLIADPVINVKDTAAWTLGRICENLLEAIKPDEFQAIVQAIIGGLSDNPKIAGSCAWSITCLAEQLGTRNSDDQTSSLSPYFETLLGALIASAQKYLIVVFSQLGLAKTKTFSNLPMKLYLS